MKIFLLLFIFIMTDYRCYVHTILINSKNKSVSFINFLRK
jgi:hypothetical protein